MAGPPRMGRGVRRSGSARSGLAMGAPLAKMPAVPDEQNSAVRLLAANRLLPYGWPAGPKLGAARSYRTPPQLRLSPAVVSALRAVLDEAAPAVAEVRMVAD